MKKFIGLVMLFSVSVICMISLGKIVAYDWPEIENEAIKCMDYIDERLDDVGKVIDEKIVMVLNKD